MERETNGFTGLYFGGTCFKYQRQVDDVKTAANVATHFMDVVTTSGPGTGLAATPEKVTLMKEGCGEAPLAIASGVTPENVAGFLPFVDCIIVATGISQNFNNLSVAKTKKLMEVVRGFQ